MIVSQRPYIYISFLLTTAAAEDMYVYYYQRKMEALQIVRDNMIDPDDWIIDGYTIAYFFSPCECKDMGIWFVGEGVCPRCEEIEHVDGDKL